MNGAIIIKSDAVRGERLTKPELHTIILNLKAANGDADLIRRLQTVHDGTPNP